MRLIVALEEKSVDQTVIRIKTGSHKCLILSISMKGEEKESDGGSVYLKGSISVSMILLLGTKNTSQSDWLSCCVYPCRFEASSDPT